MGRSGNGVTSGAWDLKVIPGHLEDELREQIVLQGRGRFQNRSLEEQPSPHSLSWHTPTPTPRPLQGSVQGLIGAPRSE